MITLKFIVLSLLLISGAVIPVHAVKFADPIVMDGITKLGFFGTGALIGFTTHVTARPEDWYDPAVASVAIATPAGLIMIRNFDVNMRAMGCNYTGENRGIELALGVLAGACAGKIVRFAIKGAAWLAYIVTNRLRGSEQPQESDHAQ